MCWRRFYGNVYEMEKTGFESVRLIFIRLIVTTWATGKRCRKYQRQTKLIIDLSCHNYSEGRKNIAQTFPRLNPQAYYVTWNISLSVNKNKNEPTPHLNRV